MIAIDEVTATKNNYVDLIEVGIKCFCNGELPEPPWPNKERPIVYSIIRRHSQIRPRADDSLVLTLFDMEPRLLSYRAINEGKFMDFQSQWLEISGNIEDVQ
ncbi:hypothetical protein N7456_011692 [Penicillium angulare]|uniref:Uncharacterized protein n=1 Tax=Penicillium angulare TaxID=116970 RepID=A0A9W9EUH1_9EURO|nr:hypothetical protein N7456_011692 [Penicillium angulare]